MLSFFFVLMLFLLLGAFAGFLSGLLGMGGGVIIVPGLLYLFIFPVLKIPMDKMMHVAAGTSLAIMIITSIKAIHSHHKYGNIDWSIFSKLLPTTVVGVIVGAYLASLMKSHTLSILFGVLLLFLAIYIFFFSKKEERKEPHSIPYIFHSLAGLLIGLSSGMLGIGGGSLIIPFLLFFHYPIHRVAGTSVALILPLSVVGTLMFMIMGRYQDVVIPYSTGFIYWPSFIAVAIGSVLLVPFGAWTGRRTNQLLLRRIFAFLLVLIAVQLIFHI